LFLVSELRALFLADRKTSDAMPAKIVPGRNALRSISGRKAGLELPRSQWPLRGERAVAKLKKHCCLSGTS